MKKLLSVFLNICLLRAGPQDLPAASVVLVLATMANVAIGTVIALSNYTFGQALVWSAVDLLLLATVAHISLIWHGKRSRFPQTFSALAGSGTLLSLLGWPLLLFLARLPEGDASAALPSILLGMLLIWSIVVIAHIMRHALSSTYGVGVLLALLYVIVSWNLSGLLYPAAN